jgi:hypothetical protein
MAPNISLTMMTDVYERAVFRVELPDSMVPGNAAVFTQSCDDLVL